jgi:hypothetical protein
MKPRIRISFSGGRTSAVMTKLVLERYSPTHDIKVVFANTGQEHPLTLDFVALCDEHLGFNTVWLEAEVNPEKGVGVSYRKVDYLSASRDGRPFRDYIAKYGVPNMGSPQCTTRLKENVLDSYSRSIGWKKGSFLTAIGIRADEAHRVSVRAAEEKFIYPLVDEGYTKERVINEVRTWGFDLEIPEHYGNCVWCWKKSYRKLLTVMKEKPEYFDFPRKMEEEFSNFKVTDATRSPDGRRLFFRGHKSVADIERDSKKPFTPFSDKYFIPHDDELDFGVGCGESCEIGADERFGTKIDTEDVEM